MMTVPPQLTSSLPSFSYPASFRHPPQQSEELSEPCFCASWVLTNRLTPPNPLWFLLEWCFPGATPVEHIAQQVQDWKQHLTQRGILLHHAQHNATQLNTMPRKPTHHCAVEDCNKVATAPSASWRNLHSTSQCCETLCETPWDQIFGWAQQFNDFPMTTSSSSFPAMFDYLAG